MSAASIFARGFCVTPTAPGVLPTSNLGTTCATKIRSMKDICVCSIYSFLLCLSLDPLFSSGWISKKCLVTKENWLGGHTFFDQEFCHLYPNTTIVAQCEQIISLKDDIADVPPHIQVMCAIGGAKIIENGIFSRFKDLVSLTLKMPIRRIFSEAFSGLGNLKHLSISINPITKCNTISLPENVFQNLSSLKSLFLQGFNAMSLNHIRLTFYIQLDELSLPRDCISDLFEVTEIFQNIGSVHTLRLQYNNVTIIQNSKYPLQGNINNTFCMFQNLTVLDLSFNPLKIISPNAFSGLSFTWLNLDFTFVDFVALSESGITKLDRLSLSINRRDKLNVTKVLCAASTQFTLRYLTLKSNRRMDRGADHFVGCNSLQNVDLSNNKLRSVNPLLLMQMPALRSLTLSANRLMCNLCPTIITKGNFTSMLQFLDFSHNTLTLITAQQFSCLPHLRTLLLSNNRISTIKPYAFLGLRELETLDLSSNELTKLLVHHLADLPSLMSFKVTRNDIGHYDENIFAKQTRFEDLRIGSLHTNIQMHVPPNIKRLEIFGKNIKIYEHNLSTPLPLQALTLRGSVTFQMCKQTFLSNVKEADFSNTGYFSIMCDSAIIHSVLFPKIEKLTYWPTLNSVEKCNMSNLEQLRFLKVHDLVSTLEHPYENPELLFQHLPALEVLIMVNSGIRFFTANFFKGMKRLQTFAVQNDVIFTFDSGLQTSFLQLSYLALYNDSFQCECGNAWVIPWATGKKETFVSGSQVFCFKQHQKDNFFTFVEKNCNTDLELILFIVTSSVVLLFMTLALLYNTSISCLFYLVSMFRAWLQRLRGRRGKHVKYEYDAFVSYCSLDQDWILQHFIPNLEDKGPTFLKLCLHNRDFEVGKDIVDNIVDSIYKSRKTICVISHNYLRSDWCSLEMRLATYRLLAEQEDVLIIVFLEHISRYRLSSYHRLAKMMKKKTYIDWPEEKEEQIIFWERLRNSLQKTADIDEEI